MNWNTTKFDAPSIARALADDRSDLCEHVEKDKKLAYVVRSELDSFGPVGVYVCCKACEDEYKKAEDEELVTCADCKQEKPRSETFEWRWFDFYAPQGDEPLIICTTCRKGEKHAKRVREDADRLLREDGYREGIRDFEAHYEDD